MAKLTLTGLKEFVKTYVNSNKQAGAWVESRDNLYKVLDKVGKMVTLDGSFNDRLSILDGDNLELGKTVEEYMIDLSSPMDFKDPSTGTDFAEAALKPYLPTVENASYSYSLGRRVFATTVPYDNVERGAINSEAAANMIAGITKKLTDSETLYKYQLKKQLLGNVAKKIYSDNEEGNADFILDGRSQEITKGATIQLGAKSGIVLQDFTTAVESKELQWEHAIKNGYIVENKMYEEIARPVDTATGEAWVLRIKEIVEDLGFAGEGRSFNGSLIGATPESDLVLFIKKGQMPVIETMVQAGAFHVDKVAVPCKIIVVDDFGDAPDKVDALLVDARGVKLHKDYIATRPQENAMSDYVNIFSHSEYTGFISKNVAFKAIAHPRVI